MPFNAGRSRSPEGQLFDDSFAAQRIHYVS